MKDLMPVLGVFQSDLAVVICKQSVDRDCLRHFLNRVSRVLTGTYKYEYDQHGEVPHG